MNDFRCKRCDRPLKHPESRERGYGLECYNKMIAEQNEEFERNQLNLSAFIDLPPVERVPTDNLRIIQNGEDITDQVEKIIFKH